MWSAKVISPKLTHRQPQSDSYDYGLHHNHEDFDTDWLIIPHIYQQGKIWYHTNPPSWYPETSTRLAWTIYDPPDTNPEKRFKRMWQVGWKSRL